MPLGLLTLSLAAWGADLPAKAQAFIDAGELETARKKCIAWEGNVAGADPRLREACAQVWLDDAKKTDTFDGWVAFRGAWSDTRFADEAFGHEADFALAALGATATEAAYLDLFGRYSATDAGKRAYTQASAVALAAITSDADARGVAERYPEQAELLLRTRLSAFVSATVSATRVSDVRSLSPLLDVKDIRVNWAARAPDAPLTSWTDHVAARLSRYGIQPELVSQWPAESATGPSFPLCYDPQTPDVTPGVVLSAAAGTAFLPAPWALGCGPDASPLWLVVTAGQVVELTTGGTHHVRLVTGASGTRTDGWADGRALVAPTGPSVVSNGRIVTPTATAHTVQGFDGGEPWLEVGPSPTGVPILSGLAAPPDEGGRAPVAPIVHRFLGFDARLLPEAPPLLFGWGAGPAPSDAVPLTVGRGDLGSFKQAMLGVGLDPATLGVTVANTIDLDSDGVIEVFADAKFEKRPAVIVWQMSTGRVWAWVRTAPATAAKPVALRLGGYTMVAWSNAAGTDALRWTTTGPTVTHLP